METGRAFVVVFNPKAGRGRARETLRIVTNRLFGCRAPVLTTSLDLSFAPALQAHIRDLFAETGTPPTVVAVGGDGTLSMTVRAMRDPSDAPVAVVPAGSGNDFAAALGMPDVQTALAALEAGSLRTIDVGVVNGRRFVNCVGMGLDAEVGALSFRLRSRGYPAAPSYYAAALIGLFMVKPVGVEVEAGGERRRYDDGVMVTVGNGPLYGGGFRGAPDARFDDGQLDAYVFTDVPGIFARLALMQQIRAGSHPHRADVRSVRAPSLSVAFDREVAMHVDGDTTTVARATFGVLPRALRISAPADGG